MGGMWSRTPSGSGGCIMPVLIGWVILLVILLPLLIAWLESFRP